jgi:glycerol-3-phosphate acyltransferase PlsY
MNFFLISLAIPFLAYWLGSIPFGLLIVRLLTNTDIRHIGSGNIGATNVKRAVGTKWAAAVLVCDLSKGFLPVWAAVMLNPSTVQWLPALTAFAAVCGHIYPGFLRFKPSGKGVATTLGALLVVAPWACMIVILFFIPTVYIARRVSVGSLGGIFILPPATWFSTHDPALTVSTMLIMAMILARHKDNLQRLAQGDEPTIGSRRPWRDIPPLSDNQRAAKGNDTAQDQ